MKERKDRRGTVFPALCVWLVVPREERRVVRLHYYCFVCMCVWGGGGGRRCGVNGYGGEGRGWSVVWVGVGSRLLVRSEGYNLFLFFFMDGWMDGWMGGREVWGMEVSGEGKRTM